MERMWMALFLLLTSVSADLRSSISSPCGVTCGANSICSQGNCTCPHNFTLIDPTKPNSGCKYEGNYATKVLALTGVIYTQPSNSSSEMQYLNCLEKVSTNEYQASYFRATSQLCFPVNSVGSLEVTEDFNDTAFFHVSGTSATFCDEPYKCGSYGICNNRNRTCSCPPSFLPINGTADKGCTLANGSDSGFLTLPGVSSSSYQLPNDVRNFNDTFNCMKMCDGNFNCLAVFDQTNRTCSIILGQVGTLINLPQSNFVTYLWVNKTETNSNNRQPISNITTPLLKCDARDACGNYGICSASGCSCPDKFVHLSLGCKPGSGYKSDFLVMNGTTYCGTYPSTNLTSSSTCPNLCSQNTSCEAAFLSATGECVLMFTEVGSLKYTSNQTDVAFLRVNTTNSSRKSPLSAKALAGIIVGIIVFIVCLIALVWCYFVASRIHRPKVDIEKEEPINHVQNYEHEKNKDIRADQIQEECNDVSFIFESGLKVYSSSQIQGMTKDYKDKIREDRFAAVYKAQTENGIHLTVKVLKTTGDFSAEISTISQMHHTNLVQLLGYCNQGSHRVLVYEYVVNDSLDAWIFNNVISPMSWKKRFNIITGIASGMAYLHEQQVLHLDLKAENIFLDAKFDAKIGHFGLNRLRDNLIGSAEYVAPEYFIGTDRNSKMDMYSFGVILLEIVSAERVLNLPGQSITDAIANCGNKEFFPSDLVDHAIQYSVDEVQAKIVIQVALLCLQRDPKKRPSMADALLMLEGKSPLQLMPSTQEIMLQQCFSFKP